MAKRIVTGILDVVKNSEVEVGKTYRVDHIFPEDAIEEIELEQLFAALPKHSTKKTLFGKKKTEIKSTWSLDEIRTAYEKMREERQNKMRKVFLRISL